VLVLRIKDGEMVQIDIPGGSPVVLKIKCTSGSAIKLGIEAPREYQVSRTKQEAK
jgi:sRNA-binding carbon storage regulator CsrA